MNHDQIKGYLLALDDYDARDIRNMLTKHLEPKCLSKKRLSKNTVACMKYVAGKNNINNTRYRRMAYDWEGREFVASNGVVTLIDRHEKPVFDKAATFDILKMPIKAEYIDNLPWVDDGVSYPNYQRYIPNDCDLANVKFTISFTALAILKALYDQMDHKKETGLITFGSNWLFHVQHRRGKTEVKLDIESSDIKPVKLNLQHLYHIFLFLTDDGPGQDIWIRQNRNNSDAPIVFETDTKNRFAMLMPVY